MPRNADTHIQNTAPGPPRAMAPATPAMLPVPTVAANAVVIACKGDTSPGAVFLRRVNAPSVRRSMSPKRRSCTKRVRAVKTTPASVSKSSIGQPQTMPESHSLNRRSPSTARLLPETKREATSGLPSRPVSKNARFVQLRTFLRNMPV